ncbi:MAG: class I adenylate-forming enzyme family protein [Stellaceae bacterium]
MTEMTRLGASTNERVALHAAERPRTVALINGGQAISFAELCRDIGKFAAAVRELGLAPGSTVAIGCEDIYAHWLLLLACERLNLATASFDRMESPTSYGELLASADLVLFDANFSLGAAARHHPITEAWLRTTLARDDEDNGSGVQYAPGDLMRIHRSSGSTGRPKRLAITRRMYELRVAGCAQRYQFARESRYMPSLSFSVGHIYYTSTACLRTGGTLVSVPTARGGAGVFADYGITHLSLQPLMLKQALDDLPPDFAKPKELAVFAFGSPTSDELGSRALERLATEVTECFGCNEIGYVSGRRMTDRDGFATVADGIEVEVLDESGRTVPRGEPGRLRIRSESMVEGYLDDPETTRQFFKDGWFYPNDVAILDGPRRLKILGRGDEMVNIAGGKLPPSDLEAIVMKHVGAGDAGICTLANRDGIQEVYVAVANARLDPQELLARITRAFSGVPLGVFHVLILASIPRNPAGKIQRTLLKEAVAAAAGLKPR